MNQTLNNKTLTRSAIELAWELIKGAKRITLLTHYKPDGDGVSACTAFESFIKTYAPKKHIETVYPSACEQTIARTPQTLFINEHRQTPDLLIQFDCANLKRLYMPDEFAKLPLINVDHHISNNIEGTVNLVDVKSSSACEVLFDLLMQWDASSITTYVAECLLYGICYDTQVFYTQSTHSKTLKAAAELIDKGANLFEIQNQLLSHKNPKIIALWGELLSNVCLSQSGQSAWISISHNLLAQHNLQAPALIGLSNFLAQISGVDIIAIFSENEGGATKVSMRSKKTDVNAIAQLFGGGGHMFAAGIMLNEPLVSAVKKVTKHFI